MPMGYPVRARRENAKEFSEAKSRSADEIELAVRQQATEALYRCQQAERKTATRAMNDRLGRGWLELVRFQRCACSYLAVPASRGDVLPTPALTQNPPAITASSQPGSESHTKLFALTSTPLQRIYRHPGDQARRRLAGNGLLFSRFNVPDGTIIARGAKVASDGRLKIVGHATGIKIPLEVDLGIEMGLPIEQALYPLVGAAIWSSGCC